MRVYPYKEQSKEKTPKKRPRNRMKFFSLAFLDSSDNKQYKYEDKKIAGLSVIKDAIIVDNMPIDVRLK